MLPIAVLINEKGSLGLSQMPECKIVIQYAPWAFKAWVDRICLFSSNELHFIFIILLYFSENELYKISFNLLAFIFQTQCSRIFSFLKEVGKRPEFYRRKVEEKTGTKPQKAAVPSSFLVNNLYAASCICVCILLLY